VSKDLLECVKSENGKLVEESDGKLVFIDVTTGERKTLSIEERDALNSLINVEKSVDLEFNQDDKSKKSSVDVHKEDESVELHSLEDISDESQDEEIKEDFAEKKDNLPDASGT
jgi:hypothetical protein